MRKPLLAVLLNALVLVLALVLALTLAPVVQASAAGIERFSVVSNGEIVGTLEATTEADAIAISYQVSNNGRGPKLEEQLTLRAGLPTRWRIDGNTAFGGAVHEHYEWRRGAARWESQADSGNVKVPAPRLYVANDASPWSYGLYARTLLRSADKSLEVLPRGTMRLEKLDGVTVGTNRTQAYSLTGINLTPDIVLLDESGALFAHLGSATSVLVRAGHEAQFADLVALGRRLQFRQLENLQRDLAHEYDPPVRIRNVRVFDPQAGRVGEPVSVVVFRDRIASIRPDAPADEAADEVTIDGEGGTLLSGLHDMHSHNSAWTGLFYLAAGVTTVRDLGNNNAELLDLVSRLDAGKLPGPRVVRAGLIEGRSPFSARIGAIPDSLDNALAQVRWYADRGYRGIKIYNSTNPDWVAPLAAEAHRLGMHVSGHVPAFMSPDRAIRDGYDEINHINQLVLGWVLQPQEDTRTALRLTALGERTHALDLAGERVRMTLELLESHGTALDPTMVILERLMLSRAGEVSEGDAPYLDHMPIGYQRYRRRSFVNFESRAQDEAYVKSFGKLLETIRLMHAQGVKLLPGTDDGSGFTVHRELELYAKAGIPAAEVLRMATLGCAQYLGLDQSLGSIAPGKLADFVLLQGNPVEDISAIRRIRLVMKGGVAYFPAELYRAVGITPFAAPPRVRAPAAN